MGLVTTTTIVNGTTNNADDVNNNITALKNVINGSIDDANISDSADIDVSKLDNPGDATKFLRGDGTWARPSGVYARYVSGVDVASSTTETNLVSTSITGGDMGTTGLLRLTLSGDVLYNNSGTDTLTFRIKFGGTTFWGDATSGATSATRQRWTLVWHIQNMNSASSNDAYGWITAGATVSALTASVTGLGAFSMLEASASAHNTNFDGGAIGVSALQSIDTASAQSLVVTAQWSVSSANNSFRMRSGFLELL